MGTPKSDKEIEHILLLPWKDDASQEAIDNAMAELRALKRILAEFSWIYSGRSQQ